MRPRHHGDHFIGVVGLPYLISTAKNLAPYAIIPMIA